MKSFTDIEQSKKLAEVLPIESADMSYVKAYFDGKQSDWFIQSVKPIKFYDVIPAWSLAALLGVLPEPELIQNQEGTWLLRIWDNKRFPWSIGGYINPVDACVEMVELLHKENLI